MTSLYFLIRSRPLYDALIILSISFISLFGYELSPLFFNTSLVLILSTLLFTLLSKQTPALFPNIDQAPALLPNIDQAEVHIDREEVVHRKQPESDPINVQVQEKHTVDEIEYYLENKSADLYQTAASMDQLSTNEESEIEWPCSERSQEMSDGSISDEESLIEIALQSGEYVKEDDSNNKLSLQKSFPNIFWQHELMGLFAEFNEEENLIEIDISMGSIKCSRFEIEA